MLEIVVAEPDKFVVDNKVIPPPAGVAHLSPVASALSATKSAILREQSQRIVFDKGIIPYL